MKNENFEKCKKLRDEIEALEQEILVINGRIAEKKFFFRLAAERLTPKQFIKLK